MKRQLLIFILIIAVGILTMGVFVSVHGQSAASRQETTHQAADGAPQAARKEVIIDNFTFTSATLNIKTGTQVTWTNHDDIPHHVVNTEKKFKSKALDTNESFSYSFTEPGTYEYFCGLHPKMVAKILVEESK